MHISEGQPFLLGVLLGCRPIAYVHNNLRQWFEEGVRKLAEQYECKGVLIQDHAR